MQLVDYLTQETTIESKDILLIVISSCIYAVCRTMINRLVLRPLTAFVPVEKQKVKFINRGFDFLHYCVSTILGTLAFSTRPYAHCWFYILDCKQYLGQTGNAFQCSVLEKIYYIYFASYYVSDILWIRTTNDVVMLIFHHFFTLSLIFSCVIVARPVYGLCLMLLHDWGDTFLYLGKVLIYLGKPGYADYSLYFFGILFFWLRIFGVASILYTLYAYNSENKQTLHPYLYYCADAMLAFLYCLHLIWGWDILLAVRRVFNKSIEAHDTRSDPGYKRTKID
ncbi:longevity assurance protein, putative [Trichomonas vaginalis G3]|uniref:Longevity assurance protein, putative n=1 Tax=Trichomonas vaginalis (strain ATCC PRA-98 / G3) TaxID=412133 RepID=A2FSZ3_TRIV3|nr:sphingosine N-acyltransferase protein [Trichomonas vaginalis G3]EAX91958.1 longevity assurance protein, putative [Trichomonas vaginalis G3]KAI5513689.1 sphingosine N-acyltransferase protein [Trichomonas vaginalis G3]|eukprot:XP_001304888.1 longevity assurance protein [Trichomonas vaginalis G3]